MRPLPRLKSEQNYGAIYTGYFLTGPKPPIRNISNAEKWYRDVPYTGLRMKLRFAPDGTGPIR